MSTGRKSHVVRIFARGRDGVKDTSSYMDVMRTDKLFITSKDQHGWQQVTWTVVWNDDDNAELNNVDTRTTHTLKIWDAENPPDDPLDPDNWLPLEVIDKCIITGWVGAYFTAKGKDVILTEHIETKLSFKNDWDGVDLADTSRKLSTVRVTYHNTSADNDLNSNDGSSTKVDADSYQLLDEADNNQYIEEEIIKQYFNNWSGQNITLANVFLDPSKDGPFTDINFAPPDAQGSNSDGDTLIPYRLDPFQTIVNICWGGDAVEFFDRAEGPP